MGGFSPFQTQAPNVGGSPFGIAPGLMGLLTALAGLPAQQQQQKEAKADVAYKQALTKQTQMESDPNSLVNQQRQIQVQQAQRAFAQTDFDQLGNQLRLNKNWASSDAAKQRAIASANILGIPQESLFDKNGNLDPNAFLKPLSSLPVDAQTQKARELIDAQPTPEKKRAVASSYGVALTDQEANAGAILNGKDQAALARVQAVVQHNADWAAATSARLKIQQEMADTSKAFDTGRLEVLRQQAVTAQGNLAARLQELKVKQDNAATQAKNVESLISTRNYAGATNALKAVDTSVSELERAATGAETALTNAYANNVDADTINTYTDNLKQAQAALTTAKARADTLHSSLGNNVPQARDVKQASGAHGAVTVTDAGGNKGTGGAKFVVGQSYTSNGVTMKFKGGDPNNPNSWASP